MSKDIEMNAMRLLGFTWLLELGVVGLFVWLARRCLYRRSGMCTEITHVSTCTTRQNLNRLIATLLWWHVMMVTLVVAGRFIFAAQLVQSQDAPDVMYLSAGVIVLCGGLCSLVEWGDSLRWRIYRTVVGVMGVIIAFVVPLKAFLFDPVSASLSITLLWVFLVAGVIGRCQFEAELNVLKQRERASRGVPNEGRTLIHAPATERDLLTLRRERVANMRKIRYDLMFYLGHKDQVSGALEPMIRAEIRRLEDEIAEIDLKLPSDVVAAEKVDLDLDRSV